MWSTPVIWTWKWQGIGRVGVDPAQGELLPGVRLGFVVISWCRGRWTEAAARAMREAAQKIRGGLS